MSSNVNVRKSYLPHFLVFQAVVVAFAAGFFTCFLLVKKDGEKALPEANDSAQVQGQKDPQPSIPFSESEDIELLVDFDLPFNQAMTAANYNRLPIGFNEETFPQDKEEKGKKKVVFKIFDLDKVTSQDIIKVMGQRGCKPATLRKLMAYNHKGPASQLGAMVALGSITKDGSVPCSWLVDDIDIRKLGPERYNRKWIGDYRFLAVKQEKAD